MKIMKAKHTFFSNLMINSGRLIMLRHFTVFCPIKNQILYFSIHSIKYTVLQYMCAKNRIKTVCKIYCNTVYLIRYNSILYTVVQNTVYLQYTFIIYIRKYSILTVSQFFIGLYFNIFLFSTPFEFCDI